MNPSSSKYLWPTSFVAAAEGITADGSPIEFSFGDLGAGLQNEPATWQLYPNPTDDQLVIERIQSQEATLQIFDYAGKRLRQNSVTGTSLNIDVREFTPGMYSLMIDNQVNRFIITR